MRILYTYHTLLRIRQRGISQLELEYVIAHPIYKKPAEGGLQEICGIIKNRKIHLIVKEETHIKIITIY